MDPGTALTGGCSSYNNEATKSALESAFGRKCYLCERIGQGGFQIDHFKP